MSPDWLRLVLNHQTAKLGRGWGTVDAQLRLVLNHQTAKLAMLITI